MKTFTNSFSFNRFKSVFCWLLAISKKKLIKILLSTTIITLCFGGIMRVWQIPDDVTASVMALLSLVGLTMIVVDCPSVIQNNKSRRMQFISMPASCYEKFYALLSLMLVTIIGVIIMIFLGNIILLLLYKCNNGLIITQLKGSDNIVELWSGICAVLSFWLFSILYAISYSKSGFLILLGCSFGALYKMIVQIPFVIESHSLFRVVSFEENGYTIIIVGTLMLLFSIIMGPINIRKFILDYNPWLSQTSYKNIPKYNPQWSKSKR